MFLLLPEEGGGVLCSATLCFDKASVYHGAVVDDGEGSSDASAGVVRGREPTAGMSRCKPWRQSWTESQGQGCQRSSLPVPSKEGKETQ